MEGVQNCSVRYPTLSGNADAAIAEEFVQNGYVRNPDEKDVVITGAVTA